ncbi:hypothetical protein [Streptomyces sp. NPDC005407]|uniref:hypothetical protein n=1 Tax=Streptomyces sp. NPDC005407 TaxID=3155340 RepID=UPI0033AA0435
MPTRTRARRTLAVLALTGLVAAGLAGCGKSYDDHVKACTAALRARADGDKAKPEACKPLKEDDYDLVDAHVALEKAGLFPSRG